jgi:hypothetical protein
MMELADIRLAGRNGESVSLSENVARVIAPIDLELAKEFSPNAKYHAGTAEWRELWWEQIWLSVHSTRMLEAFGHGYGFDLFSRAPTAVRAGQENWEVRTPHSVFFYALGYTGGLGLLCLVFCSSPFSVSCGGRFGSAESRLGWFGGSWGWRWLHFKKASIPHSVRSLSICWRA